jgi:Holliday junction DNA helicase RuvB
MLSSPLRDRFGVLCRLEMYSVSELAEIVSRSAIVLGTAIDREAAVELASRSRGTPRIANRLLKRVRDYSAVLGHESITLADAKLALERMEIDPLGLDNIDINILTSMITKFSGGPVGLETLAATINEDKNTIEDVYEPYLLQLGFIARTPRGRVCTKRAYEHLGIKMTAKQKKQLSIFDGEDDE